MLSLPRLSYLKWVWRWQLIKRESVTGRDCLLNLISSGVTPFNLIDCSPYLDFNWYLLRVPLIWGVTESSPLWFSSFRVFSNWFTGASIRNIVYNMYINKWHSYLTGMTNLEKDFWHGLLKDITIFGTEGWITPCKAVRNFCKFNRNSLNRIGKQYIFREKAYEISCFAPRSEPTFPFSSRPFSSSC